MVKHIKEYLLLSLLVYYVNALNPFYEVWDQIEILDHETIKSVLDSTRFTWVEVNL